MKQGSRIFSITESFRRDRRYSVLAGVVYRLDGVVDGVYLGYNTVGGRDSTDNIIRMIRESGREDINYILISGAVISWFNIVDLDEIHHVFRIPVISVTYEESEGIFEYLQRYFRDWEERLLKYLRLGDRHPYTLKTGYRIFIRSIGIDFEEAGKILDEITRFGKIPEPIRIGRMIASAANNLCS